MTRYYTRLLPVVLLLLSLTLAPSCSEKIMPESGPSLGVEIRTPLGIPAEATQAVTFVVTVTGPGILEPIYADLLLIDGYLVGSIEVPAGPARRFRIDAFDQAGGLVYTGVSVADVGTDSEFVLTIDMLPVVSMIKLSPTYLETLQGDVLAMKVRVFNLPDIGAINIMVDSHRIEGNYHIVWQGITLNPALSDIVSFDSSRGEGGEAYLYISLLNVESSIVGPDGYVEIGTITYQTQNWESPLETVDFYPYVQYLEDKSGNSLSVETVHQEIARVLLYARGERTIARYPMSNESATGGTDPNIRDVVNGLDGMATGTTWTPYGMFGEARELDGVDDFIRVPHDDLLNVSGQLTLVTWLQLGSGSAIPERATVLSKKDESGAIDYQLQIENRDVDDGYFTVIFRFGEGPYAEWRTSLSDQRIEGWVNFTFTFEYGDPSSARLFCGWQCDMVEYPGSWNNEGLAARPAPGTTGELWFGRDQGAVPSYFKGTIDDFYILDILFNEDIVEYYDYCY